MCHNNRSSYVFSNGNEVKPLEWLLEIQNSNKFVYDVFVENVFLLCCLPFYLYLLIVKVNRYIFYLFNVIILTSMKKFLLGNFLYFLKSRLINYLLIPQIIKFLQMIQ